MEIVDVDGHITYSNIIALRPDNKVKDMVFPNPFRDGFRIVLNNSFEKSIVLSLFNSDGKKVVTRNITLQRGGNVIDINNLEELAPGNYFLELNDGNRKLSRPLIKQ